MAEVLFVAAPIAIRWILHVPSGIVQNEGEWHNMLRDLEGVYGVIPHAQSLVNGLLAVGTAASILIWWNFANMALIGFAGVLGPFQLLIALVDLALTLSFIVGLAMQGTFLPATYDGCDKIVKQNDFFKVANETLGNVLSGVSTPQSICRDLVWNRAFAIVVISLYSVITTANLTFGLLSLRDFIKTTFPDALTKLYPSSMTNTIFKYIQDGRESAVGLYHSKSHYGSKVKQTIFGCLVTIKKWPSTFLSTVSVWIRARSPSYRDPLDLVVNEEEAVGLMPQKSDGEIPRSKSDETAALINDEQRLKEEEIEGSRRWSDETITGAHV